MTFSDIKAIAADDLKFRETVLVSLTRLEEYRRRDREDIDDVMVVVWGETRDKGLVSEVATLKQNQSLWNKGLAVLQGMLALGIGYLGLKK